MEHVLPTWVSSWSLRSIKLIHTRVRLGERISSLSHSEMKELLQLAGANSNKVKYLLMERKAIIRVIVRKDATAHDIFQSFFHALVTAYVPDQASRHLESLSWMDKHYEDFIQKLKLSGWKTDRLLSPSVCWRANWVCSPRDEKID